MTGPRRLRNIVSGSLGIVGAGLAASSYLWFHMAQTDHNAEPTTGTASALEAAAESGNTRMSIGLVAVGASVVSWMLIR